ncbi:hypothetical protein [Mycoplasmopsis columboralis]|uniref:Phage portal protein n=1 Tax=Mycoplasmopsis columboralis TaxID=171282 RepID=A0A449B5S6_9BACT|nr:hypothetical protein [Mycoplasmopsis columboralis]VEU75960.1 Uncharacterised protein [Mycoplasmopsis columboralis]
MADIINKINPAQYLAQTLTQTASIYRKEDNAESVAVKHTYPNYKNQIEEYGANLQSTTLANALPKIETNSEELTQQIKNLFNNWGILELYQKLEYQLYKSGVLAFGYFQNMPTILEILEYQTDNANNLIYLNGILRRENDKNGNPKVYALTYDLNSPEVLQTLTTQEGNKIKTQDLKTAGEPFAQELITGYIPFIIFKNRHDSKKDIELVNAEYFEAINNRITQLQLDPYFSTPLPVVNGNSGSGQPLKATKAIFSLGTGRIYHDNTTGLNDNINPFAFASTPNQTAQIIQAIDNLTYIIKKFLIMKVDSTDGGTHNMHTAEIQQLNSDYADYIESKANLREIYFFKFVALTLKHFLNIYDINGLDLSITVVGSTKWREETARKALTDQNGVLLNQQANQLTQQPNEEPEKDNENNA